MGAQPGPKGDNYERKINKILSAWTGLGLIKVPMSGGWAGGAGDSVTKDRASVIEFPHTVECKKQERWCMEELFKDTGLFNDWMAQAIREAKEDSRSTGRNYFPLLIFSRNYKPDFIACPTLPIQADVIMYKVFNHIDEQGNTISLPITVMLLEELINNIDYAAFRKLTQDSSYFNLYAL